MSASKTWELDVEVDQVRGWQRPGFRRNGMTYTKPETRQAERIISDAWREAHGSAVAIEEGPVYIEVHVYRRMPGSRPKKLLSEPDAYKPDIDNIAKLVLDALNGLAYTDDKQITAALAIKHDRTRRESELIHIKVERL